MASPSQESPQICLDEQFASAMPVLGHDACCAHDGRLFSQERIFCQRVKVSVRKEESGGSHRLDVSQAPKEVPWTVS